MASFRRSLVLSLAENNVATVISFISTVVLARLLSPAEIGTFSIGVVLVGLAHIVRDFGVGRYIVQERELTPDRIRAAFTVTLTLAWCLAAVLALASTLVAEFYGAPGIAPVIWVLAANFVLVPFGSVTMAYLRREMNFGAAFAIKTAAAITHAATGIGLAFLGFSYMSLAWAATAGIVVTIIGCAWCRPRSMPWLPGLREVRRVLKFGVHASSASVATEISSAAPDLIIGKALDVGAVAIFGRAAGLIASFERVVTRAIWTVAMPHFATQVRAGSDMRASYLRVVGYVTGVSWPFYAVLAVLAFPAVRILFGTQWDASVPLARILCVAAALSSTFTAYGDFILAHGEVKTVARLVIVWVIIKVVAIVAAIPFGLTGIAAAIAMSTAISMWLPVPPLRRLAGITLGDIAISVAPSLGVMLFACIGPVVTVLVFGWEPVDIWRSSAWGGGSAVAGWIVGIFVLKHGLAAELKRAFVRPT